MSSLCRLCHQPYNAGSVLLPVPHTFAGRSATRRSKTFASRTQGVWCERERAPERYPRNPANRQQRALRCDRESNRHPVHPCAFDLRATPEAARAASRSTSAPCDRPCENLLTETGLPDTRAHMTYTRIVAQTHPGRDQPPESTPIDLSSKGRPASGSNVIPAATSKIQQQPGGRQEKQGRRGGSRVPGSVFT